MMASGCRSGRRVDAQDRQASRIGKFDTHDKGGVGHCQKLFDEFFSGGLLGFLLLNEEESRAVVKQAHGVGGHPAADDARSVLFGPAAEQAIHSLGGHGCLAMHEYGTGTVPLLIPAKNLSQ
jgi:hypothetical protein